MQQRENAEVKENLVQAKTAEEPKAAEPTASTTNSTSSGKKAAEDAPATPQKKGKYRGKGLDAHGRPRNFYNPPGKVLKHLAQQNYYDGFYVNQAQYYVLKQKYKTQMCKHQIDGGQCPLQQYCQFAHGDDELRQPNDPLPK